MKDSILLFIKGIAMGAANVIPGVSGGTIALVTGIYEQLIDSLKSFDLKAVKLFTQLKFKELLQHVNAGFLLAVFIGVGVSIFSLAKLLKTLMEDPVYERWVMAFFFGLILVSTYSVGRTVGKWTTGVIAALLIGLGIALSIALLTPASENSSFFYLFLCGIVGVCSMILPGLSGSFILIVMGNYKLVMLDAVSEMNFKVLLPVVLGSAVGLIAFSQLLSWIFHHYRDLTISLMTGFILGSLSIIWPWKNKLFLVDEQGAYILKKGAKIVSGYEWMLPDFSIPDTWIALLMMILGGATIWALERFAAKYGVASEAAA